MVITAAEFNSNFWHYLDLSAQEELLITRDGKPVAKLSNPNISVVDSLRGVLKDRINDDIDMKKIKEERLMNRYENND